MKQVQHILDNNCPTLIVCATDNIALGAMKVIHSHSLSVPGDISVTGFGGYDISEMVHPSLTTIAFDYEYAGKLAPLLFHSLLKTKLYQKYYTPLYIKNPRKR